MSVARTALALVSALLVATRAWPARAATAPSLATDVDAIVAEALSAGPGAGVSVAVVRGGETLLRKGYGRASIELDVPATGDTVYHIDSISKHVTAAAILQLVDAGALALDDPVSRWVPEAAELASGVTVRMLLNHTSGIADYTDQPAGAADIERLDFTHADFLRVLKGRPPLFAAGQRWAYDNSGYYLLGMIIERATGQPYAEYMARRVFEPLGLRDTRYCDARSIVPRRAAGYVVRGGTLVNADLMTWLTPYAGGGLCSTVGDLAAFELALVGGKLLAPATLAAMHAPTRLANGVVVDYGLGTRLGSLDGHAVTGHTGTGGGFNNVVEHFPADDLTVVVLSNADAGRPARAVAARIARRVLGVPPATPKDLPPGAAAIHDMSGDYRTSAGPVTVFGENGRLRYRYETGGPSFPMPYQGADLFQVEPDVEVRVLRSGGRVVGTAVYESGLMMDVAWRVP